MNEVAVKELIKKKKRKLQVFNAFDVCLYIFLVIFALLCLYPMWYVFIGALNEGIDYMKGGVWLLPRKITLYNYYVAIQDSRLLISLKNTFLRTIINTLFSLTFTSLTAYGMSHPKFRLRKLYYNLNIFTMFFGGGLIPTFMVITKLGFYNSFWVYVIPSMYSVYNMIIFSNFFKSIPNELRESAEIDGAGELTIFFKIYLPLSKPVFATVGLWLIIGNWNSYMATMIYTSKPELSTLQYYLMSLIKQSLNVEVVEDPSILDKVNSTTLTYASIIVATFPILVVYPFIAKNFTKGMMLGSVKG